MPATATARAGDWTNRTDKDWPPQNPFSGIDYPPKSSSVRTLTTATSSVDDSSYNNNDHSEPLFASPPRSHSKRKVGSPRHNSNSNPQTPKTLNLPRCQSNSRRSPSQTDSPGDSTFKSSIACQDSPSIAESDLRCILEAASAFEQEEDVFNGFHNEDKDDDDQSMDDPFASPSAAAKKKAREDDMFQLSTENAGQTMHSLSFSMPNLNYDSNASDFGSTDDEEEFANIDWSSHINEAKKQKPRPSSQKGKHKQAATRPNIATKKKQVTPLRGQTCGHSSVPNFFYDPDQDSSDDDSSSSEENRKRTSGRKKPSFVPDYFAGTDNIVLSPSNLSPSNHKQNNSKKVSIASCLKNGGSSNSKRNSVVSCPQPAPVKQHQKKKPTSTMPPPMNRAQSAEVLASSNQQQKDAKKARAQSVSATAGKKKGVLKLKADLPYEDAIKQWKEQQKPKQRASSTRVGRSNSRRSGMGRSKSREPSKGRARSKSRSRRVESEDDELTYSSSQQSSTVSGSTNSTGNSTSTNGTGTSSTSSSSRSRSRSRSHRGNKSGSDMSAPPSLLSLYGNDGSRSNTNSASSRSIGASTASRETDAAVGGSSHQQKQQQSRGRSRDDGRSQRGHRTTSGEGEDPRRRARSTSRSRRGNRTTSGDGGQPSLLDNSLQMAQSCSSRQTDAAVMMANPEELFEPSSMVTSSRAPLKSKARDTRTTPAATASGSKKRVSSKSERATRTVDHQRARSRSPSRRMDPRSSLSTPQQKRTMGSRSKSCRLTRTVGTDEPQSSSPPTSERVPSKANRRGRSTSPGPKLRRGRSTSPSAKRPSKPSPSSGGRARSRSPWRARSRSPTRGRSQSPNRAARPKPCKAPSKENVTSARPSPPQQTASVGSILSRGLPFGSPKKGRRRGGGGGYESFDEDEAAKNGAASAPVVPAEKSQRGPRTVLSPKDTGKKFQKIMDAGISAQQFRKLKEAGLIIEDNATQKMREAGITPDQISRLREAGLTIVEYS